MIVFLVFLFIGIKIGENTFTPFKSADTLQEAPLPSPTNTGDSFLLVIYVDDLSANDPYLEGVWLINFQSQKQNLLAYPLLPSQNENGIERDKELSSVFSLDNEKQPNAKFFKILSSRNISWQGYVIIDKLAIIQIVDFLGKVDLGQGPQGGTQILSKMLSRSQDRFLAQQGQAALIQAGCLQTAQNPPEISFSEFFTGLPQHLAIKDTSPLFWEEIWHNMVETGNLTCKAH